MKKGQEHVLDIRRVSRRDFLKGATTAGAGLFLSQVLGCAPVAPAQVPAVQATPVARKAMTIGLIGEPAGLGTVQRTGIQGGQVNSNIIQNLARSNLEKHAVEPELAEDWSQEDELTWVVKLKEGVQWQKGYGELTAEDVAYTVMYQIDNETFQAGTSFFTVDSVKARDKYVVEYTLTAPFGAFPSVVLDYGGSIVSKNAHEEMGDEEFHRNPVGTGPYQLESWTSGSHLVLRKHPDYWRPDRPKLDEITCRFIPEATVRLQALRRGEIDYMDHPESSDVPDLREGEVEGIAYNSVAGWNWDYMAFTFPPYIEEDFPTQTQAVRQAMSYALDRQAIVDAIYFGEATVTDNPIPPGFLGHRPSPIRYPARGDLDRAKALMAEAGVDSFDIECITSDKEWIRRAIEIGADQLSEIGINVSLQGLDVGTWTDRWIQRHDFQMLWEDISIVSPDPDSTVYWFHHTDTVGWHGWDNGPVDEWLDEARAVTDSDRREELYHQVVDRVLEACPYIYVCHVNIVRLWNDGLAGFLPTGQEFVLFLEDVEWAT
jgi:peptide/nickel transport system substrate-binding protein